MNIDEARTVLKTIVAFDKRTIGEADILAWGKALEHAEPASDAVEAVVEHYRCTRDWIMPADVLARMAQIKARRIEETAIERANPRIDDAHCGIRHCPCTHGGGCFKGWLEGDLGAIPCPQCRPELARRVASIPPPGKRDAHDMSILKGDKPERKPS